MEGIGIPADETNRLVKIGRQCNRGEEMLEKIHRQTELHRHSWILVEAQPTTSLHKTISASRTNKIKFRLKYSFYFYFSPPLVSFKSSLFPQIYFLLLSDFFSVLSFVCVWGGGGSISPCLYRPGTLKLISLLLYSPLLGNPR